jgi:hypothetical protein
MKKLLISVLLVSAMAVHAQTNTNTLGSTNGNSLLPGGFGTLASDFGNFFADATNYFGKGLRVGSYALYNQHQLGVLVDASYPINNNMGVGFGVAYLDHTFYDTTINLNIGTTWKVPLIGNVYSWIESGPAYDLHNHQMLAQSFLGVTKDISFSTWHIFATGGVGNISTRPGQTYIAGFSVRPPGW